MRKRKKRLSAAALSMAVLLALGMPQTVMAEEQQGEIEEPQVVKQAIGTTYLYDFNITGSKTAEGWTGITVNKKNGTSESDYYYTAEKGYGIVGEGVIQGRNESVGNNTAFSIPEEVYKDYAILKDKEFATDIENGTYTVQIIVGSVNSNTTKVSIEGKEEVSINPGKEKYDILTIDTVEVADGQMNFKFAGDGRVNGIIIGSIEAPQNVQAQVDMESMKVDLTWNEVESATSYNIYRTKNKVTTKIGSVDAGQCTYSDLDVNLMETYSYTVKAVNGTGIESAASTPVEVEVKDNSPAPAAPANLKLNVTSDSTTISWDPVEKAVKYEVYWSDRNRDDLEGTEGYALAGDTEETSFTYNKSTHIQRWFKVVAVGTGGKSEPSASIEAEIQNTIEAQAEYLDRGLVAVKTADGVFVSFRIPGDEYAKNASYRIYRDGEMIKEISPEENSNYLDPNGTEKSRYTVQAVIDGTVYQECSPVTPWSEQYMEVELQQPDPYYDEKLPEANAYEYKPNDTNVADVDGDGEYELLVKWDGISYDNSIEGYTSPVYIDCYKLDGTLLWRINLGINIRAGAHYTQFQVYDFDGDGKAEIICKTADGTVDGKGKQVDGTDEVVDYRSVKDQKSSTGLTYARNGYVLDGPEYLTLFDGETGEAINTVDYDPPRGDVAAWGDAYGNRVDRFLAGVAYLDGVHPSAIFSRGYYTRAVVCAYDVVNDKLVQRWKIDSNDEQSKDLYGQGAHSLTASDVDDDGCQEVIFGSATIDHDGTLLYSLSQKGEKNGGHGDAERVSDFNLKNPGKEIFMVHENYPWDAGFEMHDGATGEYVFAYPTTSDTGRGVAADIDPRYEGAESWAIATNSWDTREGKLVTQDGELISETIPAANHMIWWDGDLGREILNHTFVDTKDEAGNKIQYPVGVYISKWDWEANTEKMLLESEEVYSNNTTKGNPCFQADIFGDWREEVAWRTADNKAIRIYTTVDSSSYRLYTLMHDIQYRAQVACQATGYNQPPTTSFYIGFDEELMNVPTPTLNIVNNQQGETVPTPTLDKSALESVIQKAESLKAEDWTQESYQAVQEALAEAKTVLETAKTQNEINEAAKKLEQAIEKLVKKDAPQSEEEKKPGTAENLQTSNKPIKTGDETQGLGIVLIVMIAAVIIGGGAIVYRRKNRK